MIYIHKYLQFVKAEDCIYTMTRKKSRSVVKLLTNCYHKGQYNKKLIYNVHTFDISLHKVLSPYSDIYIWMIQQYSQSKKEEGTGPNPLKV